MNAQAAKMEKTISAIAGVNVEMTYRGGQSFTFSTDDRNEEAANKIAEFFGSQAAVEIQHDDECGSCVYIDL